MPIRMTGLVSNMDTESIIQSLMSVQRTKLTKIENKKTKLEWKQEIWKELNKKVYSFYSDTLSKFRLQSNYATKKGISSDESVATVTASGSAAEGNHSLKVSQLASAQFVTSGELKMDSGLAVSSGTKLVDLGMTVGKKIKIKAGEDSTGTTFEIKEGSTITDFVAALKKEGLNASYDATQGRFFISSKQSGTKNAFTLEDDGILDDDNETQLSKLKLSNIKNNDGEMTYGGSVTLVKAQDAKFNYNGVDFTSSTNDISINGLSITLKGITKGADTEQDSTDDVPISLSVTNDTKAVYDMVRNFVKTYNSLLKEMNTYYYADSSKGYEPLTDEEKEAMTEEEVEKWEKKIKDSLLRREDTLSSLLSSMKTNFSGSVEVNGKSYSLSSFGISTSSDYTEKGLLHIAGDPDDSVSSGLTDKLMAALSEDPDTVAAVLTKLAGNLYSDLSKSMTSTSLRSTLTVYNDKEMKKTLTDYSEELKEMEDKLKDMEDRYYKQFSAMETALAKLNAQSTSLASLLGNN